MPQTVVGALIVDSLDAPRTVLAARRTRPAELAGMWEFPGGKVEDGESPRQALAREVREELSVEIEVGAELEAGSGTWPISERFELRLFFATVVDGQPRPGDDHDELRELSAGELDGVAWLPSDRAAVEHLRASLEHRGG